MQGAEGTASQQRLSLQTGNLSEPQPQDLEQHHWLPNKFSSRIHWRIATKSFLLEARAQVESKVAELQEVWHEHDKLEDAVALVEPKLCKKEDELNDIWQELGDALLSGKVATTCSITFAVTCW